MPDTVYKSFISPISKRTGDGGISGPYHRYPNFIKPGPLESKSYGFENTSYELPGRQSNIAGEPEHPECLSATAACPDPPSDAPDGVSD